MSTPRWIPGLITAGWFVLFFIAVLPLGLIRRFWLDVFAFEALMMTILVLSGSAIVQRQPGNTASYWDLLWRNGTAALLYGPIAAALTNTFFTIATGLLSALSQPTRFSLLMQGAIPFALVAWIGGMVWSLWGIVRMVGRRLKVPKREPWAIFTLVVNPVKYWIPLLVVFAQVPWSGTPEATVVSIAITAGYGLICLFVFQLLYPEAR